MQHLFSAFTLSTVMVFGVAEMAAELPKQRIKANSNTKRDGMYGDGEALNQKAILCEPKQRSTRRPTRLLFRALGGLVLWVAFGLQIALAASPAEEFRRPEAFTHHYAQLRDIRLIMFARALGRRSF
jgi:hypothetical protein